MNSYQDNALATEAKTKSEDLLIALSREARRLHKLALSNSKMKSLPVLRRLINSQVLSQLSLVELYQQQSLIQRKHLLNLLAKEMGYSHWALLKSALEHPEVNIESHSSAVLLGVGYPNLWFSNMEKALEYTSNNSGKAVRVGEQAVVVPNNSATH